jgi:opacity protein-like surface antigen
MRGASLLWLSLLLIASAPAAAQQIELTPLASYASSDSIDRRAAGITTLSMDGGQGLGAQATWFIASHLGVEAFWMHQATAVSMTARGGGADALQLTTNQLLGTVVYQLRADTAQWRPFVFGGAGATIFSADDVDGDTKPAWTAGGGVKWFVSRKVGMKAQARYAATVLDDASSASCGPFGFCQQSFRHGEFAVGAVFRF